MNVRDVLISKVASDPYFAIFVSNEKAQYTLDSVYSDSGDYFIFHTREDAEAAIKSLKLDDADVREVTFSASKEKNSHFCYLIIGKVDVADEESEEYFIFANEVGDFDMPCCFTQDIDDAYIRDEVNNDIGIITSAYIIVK